MGEADITKAFLAAIRQRPGLYWGGSDHPFTSLVAFLSGYDIGRRCRPESLPSLVPGDFHQFVTERFGRKFPCGGMGWMTFIEENTKSEQEALELFFQLREEYDQAAQDREDHS